jgi:hypothetical protein
MFATALTVNATAAVVATPVVWDGTFTILNNPAPASCGPLKRGQSFPAVVRPYIAGVNPEQSQINIFGYRFTFHVEAASPVNTQFSGSGTWGGAFVGDDGLITQVGGTFASGALAPNPVTTANAYFHYSGTFTFGSCTVALRGAFSKRP